MKIALCSNYQRPHLGGMEELCEQLKQAFLRAGHEVTYITTDLPKGALRSTAENVRIPAWNVFEPWLQVNCPIVNPLHLVRFIRLLKSHEAVHVHSLAPGVTTLVLLAALLSRKRLVVSQQVALIPLRFNFLNFLQKKILPALARFAVRRGASLTFPSPGVRDYFAERARLCPKAMSITPNAHDKSVFSFVEEDEREAAMVKLRLPRARLRILFAGRFVDKKGIIFIKALGRALPEVHFTLVGEGPINPKRWQLPNVRTVAPQSPKGLREYFASHDLLLLPSVGEGWPLVICEAMACGLPCLISRETYQNFNQDEEMFLVCDPEHASLRATLEDCVAGEVDLLRRRRELAAYADATWDWDRTAEQFLKLFRQGCARAHEEVGSNAAASSQTVA